MSEERSVTYQTHWKNFFSEYVKAWLLVPVFGAGFFRLTRLNKRVRNGIYRVYNDRIVAGEGDRARVIPIEKLTQVKSSQTESQRKHGLSDLHLHTETDSFTLEGIEQADALEDVLYIAIESEKRKRAMRANADGDFAHIKPGGLEPLNDLVGMWQQGLITDEDFEREKRKYRKDS